MRTKMIANIVTDWNITVEGCGPGDLIITYETISVGEHILIFKADLQMYF